MSYFQEAQKRAQRRKSPWNLLLIPAVIVSGGFLWYAFFELTNAIHSYLFPGESLRNNATGFGPVLATVAPFFGIIPIALLFANGLVWLVRPARQTLEREAENVPGTSFLESQRQLLHLAKYVIPASAFFWALGVGQSWHPN